MCFKNISKKVSRVLQECFNEVLFCNFVLAWISSQLPEQKEGLFFSFFLLSFFPFFLLFFSSTTFSSLKAVCLFESNLFLIFTAAAGSAEVVIMLKSCVFVGLFVARFRHFYKNSFAGISNI